ncbi:MAG TPA: hydroxymethylglutaryl-CoA reductase [Actinobacteria bacterium]|jgi:hydroxymethylglutaryl-CoA reductase (NADPH)|nr:hydroxymethylglutaryl-CoA reductase [Actinomycetota bacterium]
MSRNQIPRDHKDDHSHHSAAVRRDFLVDHTGTKLDHIAGFSFDPHTTRGNIENFIGAAQVPIGIAGPLLVHGEHASGEFYVPLATTEGALVASYNRGMRVIHESGGATVTIAHDRMQRSPAFLFASAREARDFGLWINENIENIRTVAQGTTSVGMLEGITQFAVGPNLYLRFDYTTGDAAGQNMTSKATNAACQWITSAYPHNVDFILSGNIDTDKKHSQINTLLSRGKRVIAEVTTTAHTLQNLVGVSPKDLFRARQISQAGAFMAGSANNGAHAANGLTALFIATGQDVANIAESHSGLLYTQLLDNGDYYWSITLPSIILATHGGGTGLATPQECLKLLGCTGPGTAKKLAEIVAATVLAGEISLASAVLAGDWVTGHEKLGRNH